MVRRWSYINMLYVNGLAAGSNCHNTHAKYTFKVFRKTTKFKKYNLGLTKIVWKTFSNRKFLSSYYNLKSMGALWVSSYLFLRKQYKNYQLVGLSRWSLASMAQTKSTNLIQTTFPSTYYYLGANTSLLCHYSNEIFRHGKQNWFYSVQDGSSKLHVSPKVSLHLSRVVSSGHKISLLKYLLALSSVTRRCLILMILNNL